MILFKKAGDLAGWLEEQREQGRSIGFVPTMGALHKGHISLIDISKRSTDLTVCSIFVNPTQFNDPKDFQKYPVTLEKDILLLEQAGTEALYLPEVAEIYPQGMQNLEKYDLGRLESILEGKYRPGHFQGVCQVMHRLMERVRPDQLFMGRKDYQQCMVVARLLELMGSKAKLVPCPIIREADGLAMSSRNVRLSEQERKRSTAIYRALTFLKDGWDRREGSGQLVQRAKDILEEAAFRIDYVTIADGKTLEPAEDEAVGTGIAVVALIAAFQGEVRLIDNMSLQGKLF